MSKLQYVQRQPDPRGGPARHYFRFPGHKPVRLPGAEGSLEYEAAHARLLAAALSAKGSTKESTQLAPAPTARVLRSQLPINQRPAFMPGAIGWVIEDFLKSKQFDQRGLGTGELALGTQVQYRRKLTILSDNLGTIPLADLTTTDINRYTAVIEKKHGTSEADNQVHLISLLWKHAADLPQVTLGTRNNPTYDAKKRHKVKNPHKAWPDALRARFLTTAPEYLKLAYYVLLYTGQRGSDVVKMKWSDFDGKRINVVQQKTGASLSLLAHRELAKVLKVAPRHADTIVVSAWKKPITRHALTHAIQRALSAIGGAGYSAHGLRKNAGVALAEAGAEVKQIMAVLGHVKPDQAIKYCVEANQTKLSDAAIAAWERAA